MNCVNESMNNSLQKSI